MNKSFGTSDVIPQVRITLVKPGSEHVGTLGKGTAALLTGIKEDGSLNKAAKRLGMAYSKAWRMMNELEAEFGCNMITRDGAHGSTLTDAGLELLDAYTKLVADTEAFVAKRAKELFA